MIEPLWGTEDWIDGPLANNIPALAHWGPTDRSGQQRVAGGITVVEGLRAGGVVSGVKPSGKPDLAAVVADEPATLGAVTTSNVVKASSAKRTERVAQRGRARAVLVNAGNANVATPDGAAHTERLASATGDTFGISGDDVVVMSTGVIGVPLPIELIEQAMPALAADVDPTGGQRAAVAMMTTDSHPKQVALEVRDDNGSCRVAGMAKGVGMIEPHMATLLVVLATDAPVPAQLAQQVVRRAVDVTFNRISVDGDQSTSDQAVMLATGAVTQPPGVAALARAVHAVCADLALQVVADGEGANRVAAVTVTGAADDEDAGRLARAVATSLLVRAAIHGADPNWGRIMMALGTAGVAFDPARVTVSCAGHTVARFGVATAFDRGRVARAMTADHVAIEVDMGVGSARSTMLTCDLSEEYVHFNSKYTT